MTQIYRRILQEKIESGLEWDDIAVKAHIRVASWMTGLPTSSPTDAELQAIAPVLNTTYEWLKYGD